MSLKNLMISWWKPVLKLVYRPKKKVKKYKVLFGSLNDSDLYISEGYYKSEKDFYEGTLNAKFLQLLESTVIEEEEA